LRPFVGLRALLAMLPHWPVVARPGLAGMLANSLAVETARFVQIDECDDRNHARLCKGCTLWFSISAPGPGIALVDRSGSAENRPC